MTREPRVPDVPDVPDVMKVRVALVESVIDVGAVIAAVQRPEAGAVGVFIGTVRDESEGRAVTLLEYEAYRTMAVSELARCVEDVEREWPGVVRVAVSHRVGRLNVGDAAVVCAVSAPHRAEAFAACRALIDAVKARVPIWKREHGPDGAWWVGWRDARCEADGHAVADHGHHRPHAHAHPAPDSRGGPHGRPREGRG